MICTFYTFCTFSLANDNVLYKQQLNIIAYNTGLVSVSISTWYNTNTCLFVNKLCIFQARPLFRMKHFSIVSRGSRFFVRWATVGFHSLDFRPF